MEEELNYASVVFKNNGISSKEPAKNQDSSIYSTVKHEGTVAAEQTDGKAAEHSWHSSLLIGCLWILGVLLVASITAIIFICVMMNNQIANFKEDLDYRTAELNNRTAENQLLIVERSILTNKTEELSRERDDLNWTLTVILKFKTFPVEDYCPNKICKPCQQDWILFQEKCYYIHESWIWKTWSDSQKYCQGKTADLVVIDNPEEQQFLSSRIKPYYDRFHGYWIGLSKTRDKSWFWVDGRNQTLGYWMPSEENNDCAMIMPIDNVTANWKPANCIMRNKFICENNALVRSN